MELQEEVAEEIERMSAVLQKSGATRLQVSSSEAERLQFWSGRKNAFPAAGRVYPDYYCMDGTIPRRKIAELLTRIKGMETKYNSELYERFSCWGRKHAPLNYV
jgi:glycolate oxidase